MCLVTVSGWGAGNRSACRSGLQERASAGRSIWKQPDLSPGRSARTGSGHSESPSFERLCLHLARPSDLLHRTWGFTSLLVKPEELVGLEWGEDCWSFPGAPGSMELTRDRSGVRECLMALSTGLCVRNGVGDSASQPVLLEVLHGANPSFSLQKTQANPNRKP